MKLFATLTLLALAAAGALAWRLGGALGWGVLAGFLCGAALSAAAVCWQQQTLLRRGSAFVLSAFALAFLAKLIVVVGVTLVLRFVDGPGSIGSLVDWRAFLIAFPVAVLCVSSLGSIGTLRVLRTGTA